VAAPCSGVWANLAVSDNTGSEVVFHSDAVLEANFHSLDLGLGTCGLSLGRGIKSRIGITFKCKKDNKINKRSK